MTADYVYDQLPDESFSFDANGNRTMAGYGTGTNNRLTSDGTYDYEHDAEGNRTKRTEIAMGKVVEYAWDHRNRLVKVVKKDSQGVVTETVDIEYDLFDRKIEKTVTPQVGPARVTQFAYDGDHLVLRFEDGNLAADRRRPSISSSATRLGKKTTTSAWTGIERGGTIRRRGGS